MGTRIANALIAYATYLGKTFWPHPLTVFYPYPETISWGAVATAAILLLGISLLAFRFARIHPYLLVGWLWFLGTLLPVIGLVQVGAQAMADRYTYVPLIGLFIMIVWGIPQILSGWRRRRRSRNVSSTIPALRECHCEKRSDEAISSFWDCFTSARNDKIPLLIGFALIFPLLTLVTRSQLNLWQNSIPLYEHTLRFTSGNFIIHNNLANALAQQGRTADSIPHYAAALRLRPDHPRLHYNLANALARQEKFDQAIHHYTRAIELKPDYAEARNNLGVALDRQGKLREAKVQYVQALQIKPNYADAQNNLGTSLAKEGNLEQAVVHFSEALRIDPAYAKAGQNLKTALGEAWKHRKAGPINIPPAEKVKSGATNYLASHANVKATLLKLPLSFEANRGQTDPKVDFLARGSGYTLFLTPTRAILDLRSSHSGSVLRINLVGASPHARGKGLNELPGKSNYFIGNDPKQWRADIPRYRKIKYEAIYPGVDLIYYGTERHLEYDLIVAPGADPGRIAFSFEGQKTIALQEADILIHMPGGDREIRMHKPRIYQEMDGVRRSIPGEYRVERDGIIRFEVAAYDQNQSLVIDPDLTYSTFIGGSGSDSGGGIFVDPSGNAYVTGSTASTDFPTTSGVYSTSNSGGSNDAFVVKLNAAGSAISYSTYLGGNGNDTAYFIAVDSSGNAYVMGNTDSTNFPTTSGAYQTSYGGGVRDAFVTKLNSTGSSLSYSTYLGGTGEDNARGIAIDSSGNAYLAGQTLSNDFPTTAGAYRTSFGGGICDAFVTKLNPTGTGLIYSTFLGGNNYDDPNGIAVDSSGNAYVAGNTSSTDFPTTSGAYQTSIRGDKDNFVTKLNSDGSGLIYSTLLGGSGLDCPFSLALQPSSGNVFVAGLTMSSDFPTTSGAYDTAYNGGTFDGFVTQLNSNGTGLVYSTYIGGSGDEYVHGVVINSAGNAYITGYTSSTNFPTTSGAYRTSNAGGEDAFLTTLNLDGTALSYSTYFGGSANDGGNGIAVDLVGNAYITGYTSSTNFPTTSGAYDTSYNNNQDAFVAKFLFYPTTLVDSPFTASDTKVLDSSNQRKIVRDANGYFYVIYAKYNGTRFDVKLARSTDGGLTWSRVVLFGTGGIVYAPTGGSRTNFDYPSIDVNTQRDQIHVLVRDANNSKILYSKCTNLANWNVAAGWTQANGGTSPRYNTILASSASANDGPMALALDANNYAHIVYLKTDGNTYYVRWNGSSWTSELQVSASSGEFGTYNPCIDIGYNDVVHVAYRNGAGSVRYTKSSDYTNFDAPITLLSPDWGGSTGAYPSLAATKDDTNRILVVSSYWKTDYSAFALKQRYSTDGGANWQNAQNIQTSTSYIMQYPLVGTGTGFGLGHKVLGVELSSPYPITFYTWNDSTQVFETRTTTPNNSNGTYFNNASLEKNKLPDVGSIGYAWYNSTDQKVYFSSLSAPTVVGLESFRADQHGDRVLLQWRTGFEVNNLGFHVYRDEGGKRVRVTPELIAGSALLTGKGIITAGYSYSWVDSLGIGSLTLEDRPQEADLRSGPKGLEDRGKNVSADFSPSASSEAVLERSAPQAQRSFLLGEAVLERSAPQGTPKAARSSSAAVRYWLEEIDLKGKCTWHGPVTPVLSSEPLPPKTQALLLSQLARKEIRRDPALAKAQTLQTRLRGHHPRNPIPHSPFSLPHSAFRPAPHGVQGEPCISTMVQGSPEPHMVQGAIEVQRFLAGQPALKLFIQEEGWYRVTRQDLLDAGLDPTMNPRYLQLFTDGEELPLVVREGRTSQLEAIEFYGRGADTPHTDTRIYWLVEGFRPAKRVQNIGGGLGGRAGPESFPFTLEKKERLFYLPTIRNGGGEKFFGALVSPEPVEQTFQLAHLDPAPPGEAILEIALQGLSDGPHRVRVFLNEADLGEVVFHGAARGTLKVLLFQASLKEEKNLVRLVAQVGEMDISLVDFLRLTYGHTYKADGGSLRFTAQGGTNLSLGGFGSSQIRVMDISDPQDVLEVKGQVRAEGAGYSAKIKVPGHGERTLLAFTEDRIMPPAALEMNFPSHWHETSPGADMVIIAHHDFLESLEPLKALREKQGLTVALIDVEDLYDEFSFGLKNPQAIRDFLRLAKTNWRPSPRFVLLVGDATFDPRNYEGYGSFDFVPTQLVETLYLETACDDCLADFDGDGLPELAVGRIPVRTAEELQTLVSKILAYEQSPDRSRKVVLVADMRDQREFDFEEASAKVKALLPGDLSVQQIYRGRFNDDDQVRGKIIGAVNEGPVLVNYAGHGSLENWRGDTFTTTDVAGLTNSRNLPFFVPMTCLNGFFHDPYPIESMAETLLKAQNGGAIAVWTSSGMTEPEGQSRMNQEMIRQLFSPESLTIGEAAVSAKAATVDRDVRKTWILFGDPAMKLKY